MIDLNPIPNRLTRPDTIDDDADSFFPKLPQFATDLVAQVSSVGSFAAGGAFSLQYALDTTTTADGDPGAGKMRFDQYASQAASTAIRVSAIAAPMKDFSNLLDTFDDSTSAIKGHLRISKIGDQSKFMVFAVTGLVGAGQLVYRNIVGYVVYSTDPAPFANTDSLMLQFTRTGDAGLGVGFSNLLVIASTQTWQPPAGITKAEITVLDGGQSSGTSTSTYGSPGNGGSASVSVRSVNPAIVYTATVGAGGVGAGAGTNTGPAAGGASSFSGSGLATLTSANGDLKIPGGLAVGLSNGGLGGASLYCPPSPGAPTGYGGAPGSVSLNAAGINGKAGVVVIRF